MIISLIKSVVMILYDTFVETFYRRKLSILPFEVEVARFKIFTRTLIYAAITILLYVNFKAMYSLGTMVVEKDRRIVQLKKTCVDKKKIPALLQ